MSDLEAAYASAGGLVILFILIGLGVIIAFYVMMALGLYTMAKNRGIEHAWFGWIPILNYYLEGELIGDEVWGMRGAKWILSLGIFVVPLIEFFLTLTIFLAWLGWILYLLFLAYEISALYKLFRIYAPEYAVIYAIFFVLSSIWIYIIRNNPPVGLQYYNIPPYGYPQQGGYQPNQGGYQPDDYQQNPGPQQGYGSQSYGGNSDSQDYQLGSSSGRNLNPPSRPRDTMGVDRPVRHQTGSDMPQGGVIVKQPATRRKTSQAPTQRRTSPTDNSEKTEPLLNKDSSHRD